MTDRRRSGSGACRHHAWIPKQSITCQRRSVCTGASHAWPERLQGYDRGPNRVRGDDRATGVGTKPDRAPAGRSIGAKKSALVGPNGRKDAQERLGDPPLAGPRADQRLCVVETGFIAIGQCLIAIGDSSSQRDRFRFGRGSPWLLRTRETAPASTETGTGLAPTCRAMEALAYSSARRHAFTELLEPLHRGTK